MEFNHCRTSGKEAAERAVRSPYPPPCRSTSTLFYVRPDYMSGPSTPSSHLHPFHSRAARLGCLSSQGTKISFVGLTVSLQSLEFWVASHLSVIKVTPWWIFFLYENKNTFGETPMILSADSPQGWILGLTSRLQRWLTVFEYSSPLICGTWQCPPWSQFSQSWMCNAFFPLSVAKVECRPCLFTSPSQLVRLTFDLWKTSACSCHMDLSHAFDLDKKPQLCGWLGRGSMEDVTEEVQIQAEHTGGRKATSLLKVVTSYPHQGLINTWRDTRAWGWAPVFAQGKIHIYSLGWLGIWRVKMEWKLLARGGCVGLQG